MKINKERKIEWERECSSDGIHGTKEDEPNENGKSNERLNDIWLAHSMKSSARGEIDLSVIKKSEVFNS